MTAPKKLLICLPDFPFPARKNGISIRYFPILEHLSKHYHIHLLAISDHPVEDTHIQQLGAYCERISVYVRSPKKVAIVKKLKHRLISLIPGQMPFECVHYDHAEICQFIRAETQNTYYHVALSVLLKYQPFIKKWVRAKCHTFDVIDSPYASYLRTQGSSLLARWEGRQMRLWERKALRSADYACYISPLDKHIGAGDTPQAAQIGVIPNGLYTQDHSQERLAFQGITMGYLGHMGYQPNIQAALRLHRIFNRLKDRLPQLQLVIIGRDPVTAITELATDPRIKVTGTVDNIWPYINGMDFFVFPMEIGSGQQNKLLEAMGAGKPVISTALGNSGIGAESGKAIIVADTDEAIAQAIINLYENPHKALALGQAAQQFVQATYAWPAILTKIQTTLVCENP